MQPHALAENHAPTAVQVQHCNTYHTNQTNMYNLKYVIVLTLCETFNSRGDDWYPASKRRDSDFDHTQRFTPHHIKIYKNEGILEELYSPNEPNFQHTRDVPEINQRNNTQMNQHIIGTSSVYIGSNPSNRTRKPVQVNYNNTINVINILQKNKHKRKIIKRRCPTKRLRQTKKLGANKAASAKFLEVFEVVQFENIACISSSGLEGICLHEYECESSGGSTMGTCADGYGTCCVSKLHFKIVSLSFSLFITVDCKPYHTFALWYFV